MPCFNRTDSWGKSLVSRSGVSTHYVVQLNRQLHGCSERYTITMNGQEIPHQLSTNFCSPLCGSGGAYEWEQDGHSFMLMYNNLGLHRAWQGFRLFIDGIDVDTGLEFKTFFRRRGLHFLMIGFILFLMGVIAFVFQLFVFTTKENIVYAGYGVMGAGAVYMFIGVIPYVKRFNGPRYIPYNSGLNA